MPDSEGNAVMRAKSNRVLRMTELVLVLFLAPVLSVHAGGRLPCDDVRVFSGAAVNALVLPYRYSGEARGELNSAGKRLTALIQQETLFAMLKYGSVGATELVQVGNRPCDVREVLQRVERRSGEGSLRPGHGLAIIWGRIYEEGADLYVQSYVRFLRVGEREAINVALPEPVSLTFTAALPAQAVALVPRRLTKDDLAAIEGRAARALVMHQDPRDTAAGRPLARGGEPLSYGVIDAQGDWMRIRSFITGESGWVRARTDDDAWALRRLMPELAYLEGVVAYLRLRTAARVPINTDPQRLYAWMEQAFGYYERQVGQDAAPDAVGLARAMAGVVRWDRADATGAERRQAAQLFQQALEHIPESADARVLAAVTGPLLAEPTAARDETLTKIDRGLLGAFAVDPHHRLARQNLELLYDPDRKTFGPYSQDDLQRRRELAKPNPPSNLRLH